MIKYKINTLNRYQRGIFVLGAIWVFLAVSTYINSTGYGAPSWYFLWRNIFIFSSYFLIFDGSCSWGLGTADNYIPPVCSYEFSLIGCLVFVIYPLLLALAIVVSIKWVVGGERY